MQSSMNDPSITKPFEIYRGYDIQSIIHSKLKKRFALSKHLQHIIQLHLILSFSFSVTNLSVIIITETH